MATKLSSLELRRETEAWRRLWPGLRPMLCFREIDAIVGDGRDALPSYFACKCIATHLLS